jgi:hypothetical protein
MAGLKLMAELGLDGTGFATGLKRAEGLAMGATRSIANTLIGMVGIGTVGLAIHKTVESASEVVIASQRLGLGVQQLQVLRQAAIAAGQDFSLLIRTFEKLEVARKKALTPGRENDSDRRAFARVGVNHDMLENQTAAQLFMGPMSKAFKAGNQEDMVTALKQLELARNEFGAMIPVLKTDFVELSKKMGEAGAMMDTLTAVKLKNLGNEFQLLAKIITTVLGPTIVWVSEWIARATFKGGKAVAEFAGSMGAGTAHQGPLRAAFTTAMMLLSIPVAGIVGPIFGSGAAYKIFDSVSRKTGYRWAAGQAGGAAAKAPWEAGQKEYEDMLRRLEKEAYDLEHQKPDGAFKGDLAKYSPKAFETPGDSLVKIGNFLGGSQTALTRMAEQRTNYLRVIAAAVTRSGPVAGQGQQSRMIQTAHMAAFGMFIPHF